ncbi:kinase-like protein, partial [Athelia psychrophila]
LLKLVREWRKLNHPNIMPCLGITLKHGLVASLVIPMCPEGSINQYVEEHPNENKLALLSQVAGGIAYLHSQGVVHGKICGNNILIAPNGRPLITDTGLSQVIQSQAGIFPWRGASESVRWTAPELFMKFDSDLDDAASEPDGACACTTSSDVWALAMTILEVMSGRMPYSHPRRMLYMVGFAIMDGILPQRPDGGTVSDDLWGVLNAMWTRSPGDRPCASFVQAQLDALQNNDLHYLNLHKL